MGVPMGFTGPYIGGFVLLLLIAIGIGGVAWFKGRHDTYKDKDHYKW